MNSPNPPIDDDIIVRFKNIVSKELESKKDPAVVKAFAKNLMSYAVAGNPSQANEIKAAFNELFPEKPAGG